MKKIAFVILTLSTLISCSMQDKEVSIINQEANIDKYISADFADSPVIRKNGASRIIIDKGVGKDSLETGDSLYFYFAGYTFTTSPSAIFATNVKEIAEKNSFVLTDADYDAHKSALTKDNFTTGLFNGLSGMKEGEHSIIVFSAKYGFDDKKVYNIPPLSALIYEVWIDKVIKQQ